MSDSNRLRLTVLKEVTFGTTPTTPRMRTMRTTGETMKYEPQFTNSAEIRDDRMNADPIKTSDENAGGVNFELSYPVADAPISIAMASALYSAWGETNSRDNDGVTDDVITEVASSGGVITVDTGTPFVANELVRNSGFTNAGNNGTFMCTTGSATVPAFVSQGLVDETSVAADARMKVVGFEGAAGDITAEATGLGSTALDFTTITGLAVGKWVKIGGTAAGDSFATGALNSWARITSITSSALTLDNLPTGWTADVGAAKTIRVFFGDMIRNGTTRSSMTFERGFMGQTTPTYIIQRGLVAGQMDLSYETDAVITGSFAFSGLSGEQTTTSLDTEPDDADTNVVMSANANVGRISENGSAVVTPNYVKSLKVTVNNNVRMNGAIGTVGSVDIGAGMCAVTGSIETYFGSNTLLEKLLAGTATNISSIAAKDNQAFVTTIPRVTFTSGAPSAGGQNQDVMIPLEFSASYDSTTVAHIQFDRFEYYED